MRCCSSQLRTVAEVMQFLDKNNKDETQEKAVEIGITKGYIKAIK